MNRGRIRIKVCGLTRLEDALCAASAGVDALGFIFYQKSPRYIPPEEARQIIERLPPFIDTVGVFVDQKREEVEEVIHYCHLGYAQLHGQESPKYCERLLRSASPCEVIKAFRVGPHTTAEEFEPYVPFVKAFLLDTYDKEMAGGTGRSFDWSLIDLLRLARPYILAGGLDATNIGTALKAVNARGVDVNSGVEVSPGIKDHRLVRDFVAIVRQKEELGC
ncbi:MAG TPA: phosphoribosylanthranilate isomerase [Desulfobulbaceae bacterium]|nr:phosphoribosylanthranilate isomerase [Desulfobulbaceae bacterium]